jgi:ComF family protein
MQRISILLDAIARPYCIECNMPHSPESSPLCPPCHRQLPWWRLVDGCPRCGTPRTGHNAPDTDRDDLHFEGCAGCLTEGSALHGCHSLVRYEGPVRRWIPGFKNTRSPFGPAIAIRLAIDHLAVELARHVIQETTARPDLIVSIPLHPRRRRWRGFNHVDPIAHRIARCLGRPWVPDALERIHDTRDQAKLVGRERRENVRGAFHVSNRLGAATRIWLVDDVLTTGSTLDAAGDALLEAGAFEVRALTLAATLPRGRAPRRRAAYDAPPESDRSHGSK